MTPFHQPDLPDARFIGADLSGVVMRGVKMSGADIDSPWTSHDDSLYVNGVNVIPFVEAELNRRFPGRVERRAGDPEGLRAAWAKLERAWAHTLERVAAMPAGTVDVSVAGQWSFAQTLRHLVFVTDKWLGQAILETPQPFHPIGHVHLPHLETVTPPYGEVLNVRKDRVAMMREYLAAVSPGTLVQVRLNPNDSTRRETVLSCLHTILEEEWDHHRYCVRDLDAVVPGLGRRPRR